MIFVYRKHKTLGCLGCPKQFNDFKDYCSHANLCKPSWKLMVTSFISYECFACKKSCKTLQQLMEHYNSCIIAIDLDVKRCNIGVVEVKDEIMFSNINFIRKKSTQISGKGLSINDITHFLRFLIPSSPMSPILLNR